MGIELPDWSLLVLFAATVLAVSVYGLAVAGHFPSERRSARLRSPTGAMVLWGTIVVAAGAAAVALAIAATHIPVYSAILAGGLAVLIAPLCLQPLPDSFVDGRRGLIVLAALAGGLAAAAWSV